MTSSLQLDYLSYPHIIEAIAAQADFNDKLRWRATCRALRQFTDSLMLKDALLFDDELSNWIIIRPYAGTEYPFFELHGNRAAQRRKVESGSACISLLDVRATAVNHLLHSVHSVDIEHHEAHANYRMGQAADMFSLSMGLEWQCSCDKDRRLSPAFSHTARRLTILLYVDDEYISEPHIEAWYCKGRLDIKKNTTSGCHLLQHALNDKVSSLRLWIVPEVPDDSVSHLPAYVFPNASSANVDPDLFFNIYMHLTDLTALSPADYALSVKSAFAGHLGLSIHNIAVQLS